MNGSENPCVAGSLPALATISLQMSLLRNSSVHHRRLRTKRFAAHMIECMPIDLFLQTPGQYFDVRSPSEFLQGHLLGAHSLPLLNDSERAAVGTTYKRIGQQQAVIQGLSFVAPKLTALVQTAISELRAFECAKVYCWRGGLRSSSVAMLLKAANIKTVTLKGGYKAFRRWVLAILQQPFVCRILGGLTGSGKTAVLQALKSKGAQVLDLEQLANHRGSVFGACESSQPTVEQFENAMALQLASFNKTHPIWLEDESRMIGRCKIPDSIFAAMKSAPLYIIERPLEDRVSRLEKDYWQLPSATLIAATERLHKKLGGARTRSICTNITEGNFKQATLELMKYYDRAYHSEAQQRRSIHLMPSTGPFLSDDAWAELLLNTPGEGI